MKIINAADFGMYPEKDITQLLIKAFDELKNISGEKTLVFSKGIYYIDSEKCRKHLMFITNTVGDNEFSEGENPHLNEVAFYLEGISDLIIEGNGAEFIIDGKCTNMALERCSNITIRNLEISHSHPDMHEIKVIKKGLFSVDYKIDKDSLYYFKNRQLHFYGKGFDVSSKKDASHAYWIGLIRKETPDKVERVHHPLDLSFFHKDMGNRVFRAGYFGTSRFKPGDRFYIYDVRRQYAGIFINECKNITIEAIKQSFNYSLAYVAQNSENLEIKKVDFSANKKSERKLASVADFIQLCMCRGKIRVTESYFDGAGDDCLNVHGFHFRITQKKEKEITVRFMHPQSHGFNALRVGDTVAFINPETLLENGQAVIEKSELINEYEIRLTLNSAEQAVPGLFIENIDACPELDFCDNTMKRIITRGLLITTRGKVTVENNRFISTTMSGILLSDDAHSWYESGMCRDVTIKNNTFDYCGETPILIKPENKKQEGAVHKNIKILGNTFINYEGPCISAKSTENLLIEGNDFKKNEPLKAENCSGILIK